MSMQIGGITVKFYRTIRIPDGRSPAQLPPGLGAFPAYHVKDYRVQCPVLWEDNGIFIPMHDKEAMWLSFHCANPRALLIGAGNVNAITGKQLTPKLESPQNYIVVPPQPWLDGWKDTDGVIYQFVAIEYKGGQGLTVGEQILGKECKTGGIGIAVFALKDKTITATKPFHENAVAGIYDSSPFKGGYTGTTCCAMSTPQTRGKGFTEYGLGKGGKIAQKIYPDPYGLDAWETELESSMAIYFVNADSFKEITGLQVPPPPPGYQDYAGPYFTLPDTEMVDVQGTAIFAGLKSVFTESEAAEEKDTQA